MASWKGNKEDAMNETDIPTASLISHCAQVSDPRVEYLVEYPLLEILVIAICGVICGADDWVSIVQWAETKAAWLQGFLSLANGIPSHDTFRRVFLRLESTAFQASFLSWTQAVFAPAGGQVAVDGKEPHGSRDKRLGKRAIDMVSAWAAEQQVALGQRQTEEKSNEITAIPVLLELLDVSDSVVTIDAIGCQKKNTDIIVRQGGDYLISVKENQGHLYQDLEFLFQTAQAADFRGLDSDYARTVDKNHGRLEIRECWVIDDPRQLAFIRNGQAWAKLQTVAMIRSVRQEGDKVTTKTRYFISSLVADAARILAIKRSHWSIENSLHWILDVAFQEDKHQLRKGNGAANFTVLRHIALSLLKQEKTAKCGIKTKRLKAGWDEDYLLKVLLVR